jgi:RNA polymerase sigma factor for flagellar operon FliA
MPLVEAIARRIHREVGPEVELVELVSLGTAGLLEAVERYDPERGATLATFAYYRVRGAIYDGLRSMGRLPHPLYRRVVRAQRGDDYLETSLYRGIGARRARDEAGANTSLTGVRALAEHIRALLAIEVLSASAGDPVIRPRVAHTAPGSDELLLRHQRRARIEAALSRLPEREQRLIRRCYFDGLSLREVADELGLSPSWTSRLHARAVARLRRLVGEE